MIINLDDKKILKLNSTRDFICRIIKKEYTNFDEDLSNLHSFVKLKEINSLRLKIYAKLNQSFNWESLIKTVCGKELESIHGKDLLVQSKINVSIQLPKDKTSILPIHTDSNSADSPFQTNVWIPLTNTFKSNSMYIFSRSDSLKFYKQISKGKKKLIFPKTKYSNNYVKLKYGQLLLFNPSLLHGNQLNVTNKTRVSLNIRVKSLFSPEPSNRNPDRRVGTYYKKFQISDDTKFGLQIIKSNFFK
tara:strand:+ start:521 stop:1258 length:738 start_codon:yes stop_codon:yes gene_type:complete